MNEEGYEKSELVDELDKKRFNKKILMGLIGFVFILIIILLVFLFYNNYKKEPIKTGENIESFAIGEVKSEFYAKIKDFPQYCSGIKFILNTADDREYFCYMNSTPTEIQFISSESETKTFDYKVPASCFGLDDFSTASDIDAVYIISSNTNQTTTNTASSKNTTNITRIFISNNGGGNSDDDDDCTPSCSGKSCGSNGCGGSCGSCPAGYDCISGSCIASDNFYIITNSFDNVIYNSSSLQKGVNASGMKNFMNFSGLIDGASANYYVENHSDGKFYVVVGKFNHTITYEEFKKNYLDIYLNESQQIEFDANIFLVSELNEDNFSSNSSGYWLIISNYYEEYIKIIWASGSKLFYLNLEIFDIIETNVNEDTYITMLDAYEEKHNADLVFPTICNDSDNGKDYSNFGAAQIYLEGYEWPLDSTGDSCQYNSQLLSEKYCENNTLQEEVYACPIWCFDDTCVNESMYLRCEDSEVGINYSFKGNASLIFNNTGEIYSSLEDYCTGGGPMEEITLPQISNYLIDYYCENDYIIGEWFDCNQEGLLCWEGICTNITSSCSDSDNGLNAETYGFINVSLSTGYSNIHADQCALVSDYDSNNTPVGWQGIGSCTGSNCYIEEAFCRLIGAPPVSVYDADADELISCPEGCLDGACAPFCGDGSCAGISGPHNLGNGEEMSIEYQNRSYLLTAVVSGPDSVIITANEESSTILNQDNLYTFENGLLIYVEDIIYEAYEGGSQRVGFMVGEDEMTCPVDCLNCTDSDGGLDYYTQGTVTGKKFESGTEGEGTDMKVYSSNLVSIYINDWQNYSLGSSVDFGWGFGKISKIEFYGIGNPQNLVEVEYSSLTDKCEGNNLIEFSCTEHGMDGNSYTCPNGCLDGACSEVLPTLSFWAKFVEWIKNLF